MDTAIHAFLVACVVGAFAVVVYVGALSLPEVRVRTQRKKVD